MSIPMSAMDAKCERGTGAMENLKAIYCHVLLAVKPFLQECNPPPEIIEQYQSMSTSFETICNFITTQRNIACQQAAQEHILDQIITQTVQDLVHLKIEQGTEKHHRKTGASRGILEYTNWKEADIASKKWPKKCIIMVTGEAWNCPPCKKQRPYFMAAPLEDFQKIIVHVAANAPFDHYGIRIPYVPTYLQKEGPHVTIIQRQHIFQLPEDGESFKKQDVQESKKKESQNKKKPSLKSKQKKSTISSQSKIVSSPRRTRLSTKLKDGT
jgi:hypothetical protein